MLYTKEKKDKRREDTKTHHRTLSWAYPIHKV